MKITNEPTSVVYGENSLMRGNLRIGGRGIGFEGFWHERHMLFTLLQEIAEREAGRDGIVNGEFAIDLSP